MRRVVFNADDAGFDPGCDAAILRCTRAGVVRGASVVANGPRAAAFAARAGDLDLAWHVNLTEGRAVAGPAPSLTDSTGRFRHSKEALWGGAALDPEEVRREIEAQYRRMQELKIVFRRVDGHNHVHLLPVVFEALRPWIDGRRVRVPAARQLRFKAANLPAPSAFAGFGFMREPTRERLLADLPDGEADVEFMVHTGCRAGTTFTECADREAECAVLCHPQLPQALRERGFEIGGF